MHEFNDADRAFMARALSLAERGLNTATPNPRVGCVLVKNGELPLVASAIETLALPRDPKQDPSSWTQSPRGTARSRRT
jgi:hypothetical protein